MDEVQLFTIDHFGGDIVCPKIGSIVSYVEGSMKLTSLRVHSSYEDFVTLLEETNEIHREDWKLYNFIHGCAWLSTTKDTGSGKGLSTTKVGGPLRYNSFLDPEPEYRDYPETNSKGLDPRSYTHLEFDFIVYHLFRYGVACNNHVESWNNVIVKVRDLPIHVFIEDCVESVRKCPTRIGRKLR
ncbi:hypothetical protein GIB67_002341 [Kingdonia uniflora]|uniref:Uncharacterized protein n=1 Tax=Kingdonia uniflora TaxID=39325 RepID=A0A7J7NZ78_9MAGN|nr:hypothetical protein GIB67_002341 [Kingdonia uniflora]